MLGSAVAWLSGHAAVAVEWRGRSRMSAVRKTPSAAVRSRSLSVSAICVGICFCRSRTGCLRARARFNELRSLQRQAMQRVYAGPIRCEAALCQLFLFSFSCVSRSPVEQAI